MKIKIAYTNFNVKVPRLVAQVYKVTPFGLPDGILETIFTGGGQLLGASAASTPVAVAKAASDGLVLLSDSAQSSGVGWGTVSVDVVDITNYLINGGFDFAQRLATPGTDTTIADEKYGPDRWRCTQENAALQYSRQDASSESGLTSRYYGEFTKITNAGKFLIYQPMEFRDSLSLRGRSVIFQVKLKASAAKTVHIAIVELQAAGTADTLPAAAVGAWNVDGTDPTLGTNLAVVGSEECSVTTSWQNFSVTGTIPSDSKNLMVMIWTDADFSATDWLGVAEAGLHKGSNILTWAPRHISDELARCQRYYFLLARGISQAMCNAANHTTTAAEGIVQFPVTMRGTPTLDAASGADYYNFRRNGANDTFNSLTLDLAHPNGGAIYNASEISGTAGQAGDFRTNNASAYVGFEAEL